MKLDEVVVHMEYKLQLYKVSSKSDAEYESFLNGPLFNGWAIYSWMQVNLALKEQKGVL